jgi:urea transport system permease protein
MFSSLTRNLAAAVLGSVLLLMAGRLFAADPGLMMQAVTGETDERVAAIAKLMESPDEQLLAFLQGIDSDSIKLVNGHIVLVNDAGQGQDLATGQTLTEIPEDAEDVVTNNRIRRRVELDIALLQLGSKDRNTRFAAAKALSADVEAPMLPALRKALAREKDTEIKGLLALAAATISLASPDKAVRLAAVKELADSGDPSTKTLLQKLLAKTGDQFNEPDADVRNAAKNSLRAIDSRLSFAENVGRVFSGLSLGSILLLAALGLAITYGVMGVINMAHGELLMVGAYSTYAVQNIFRNHFPQWVDWYVVAAVPVSFMAAAIFGVIIERTVIRFLYGRPLETLLATWGVSLILIQTARVTFGAQNVEVANPSWMSGGIDVISNVTLPWNRIAIIFFSIAVLLFMWALLNRTRLGMFVRAVTQNRPMAGCVGVPTARIDTLAFALGAGIAGLGGCALSQVANVGPDMGQGYIVDSFMVVVLGGVGQLAGAVYAALGLGIISKFLEGWTGAVIAKIVVLVFIILFIQKRPQGLFALKGRFVES